MRRYRSSRLLLLAAALGWGGILLFLSVKEGTGATPRKKPPAADPAVAAFLEKHWRLPTPPQGPAPPHFSRVEASLHPEGCGGCHRPQYEEWKRTRHALSLGPGVLGQTRDMISSDPASALICYSCHAPLTEQQEKIRLPDGSLQENPVFDTALQAQGITCAGCHVRNHERFGPPKRKGAPESDLPPDQLSHNGVTRTTAFEAAEFCTNCHQFTSEGFALNGKLLQNTYNEWKEGPYAKLGVVCQTCHMPNRAHLWRGIHDPEQVKGSIVIRVRTGKASYTVGESLRATVTVTNRGVGHMFPTYVTPKVFIRMHLQDASGAPVAGTAQEEAIGRAVTLDLSQELYDTRIPPGKSRTVRYTRKITQPNLALHVRVVVEPDHFYVGFFQALLEKHPGGPSKPLLEQALEEARHSAFTIFDQTLPLPPPD